MADHSSAFLLVTILAFITVILIFAMKYLSAGRTARLQAASNGHMSTELADIKSRLAAIEKLLKEIE